MLIENKKIFLYHKDRDSNIFDLYDTEKSDYNSIYITRENINKIIKFFQNDNYAFCGYGNSSYEDIIINMIIDQKTLWNAMSDSMIINKLKDLDETIFSNNSDYADDFKYYKYMHSFNHFDLSVIMFAVNNRPLLEDLKYTLDIDVRLPEIDIIKYVFEKNISYINARLEIEKRFDIDLLDKPDIDIGIDILKKRYLMLNNLKFSDLSGLRSECSKIKLSELIDLSKYHLDYFTSVKDYINSQVYIPGYSSIENEFIFDNLKWKFGLGGIKCCSEPNIFKSDEDITIIHVDASSFYPSIAVKYGIKPSHLNEHFTNILRDMLVFRLIARDMGLNNISYQMKRALNAVIGKMMYDGWLYDPKEHTRLVLIGNCIILSLVSLIKSFNSSIIQVNNDGIYFSIHNDEIKKFQNSLNKFIDEFNINFKYEELTSFYLLSSVDNIAFTKDNSYSSGIFDFKENYGKMSCAQIIPILALNNLALDEKIDKEHIQSYVTANGVQCLCEFIKAQDGYGILYNNKVVYRLKYFYSERGQNIFKCKYEFDKLSKFAKLNKNTTGILEYTGQCELVDIDYKYYIKEAKKIVDQIKSKQLELF